MRGNDRCTMPVGNGFTFCSRKAQVFYMRDDVPDGGDHQTIAAYCRQHDGGAGSARLLHVLPWEWSYRYDRGGPVGSQVTRANVARKGGQS